MLALRSSNNPNVLGLPWTGMNGLGCGGKCGMGAIDTATLTIGLVAIVFLWPLFSGSGSSRFFK